MSNLRIWLPIGLFSLYLASHWLYERRRPSTRITLPASQVITFGLMVAWLIGLVTAAFLIGGALKTDEGGVLSILVGLTLVAFSFLHPTWLWELAKVPLFRLDSESVSFRYLLSDIGAFVLYLVLGIGLITVGGIRIRLRADDIARCSALYTAATDSHARARVIQLVPRPTMGSILQVLDDYRPLTCGRYREQGAF